MTPPARLIALALVALLAAPAPAQVLLPTPATLGGRPGELVRVPLPRDLKGEPLGVWSTEPFAVDFRVWPGGQRALELRVPANTRVGLYPLRLVTTAGVSDLRPFTVDDRPDTGEHPDHGKPGTAQDVTARCVVVGALETETLDYYRVPVTARDPLTVEAFARRIGSPLDPVVTLLDGGGKPLPGAYADDTPGLQGDARVTHTPAADGFVLVEVRDSTFKGGPDHRYRLRIGPGLTVASGLPFAVSRRRQTGPNAAGVPLDRLLLAGRPWVLGFPAHSGRNWPVTVRVTDEPQFTEAEPNDAPAAAQVLPVPSGVSAGFAKANDRDHFKFALKAGETVSVVARTADVLSPCDVLLKVLDPAGGTVGASDPQKPLAEARVTAKTAGDYVAVCEHLNYLGGPAETYWLQLLPVRPDFTVTLADPRGVVPAGGVGLLPGVTVTRREGFAGPVTLTVAGPDGLSGTLTVPNGVSGPVSVPVAAPAGKPGAARCAVVGTGGGLAVIGDTTEALRASFPGVQTPAEWNGAVAVGVLPAGLKAVALAAPNAATAGKSVKFSVTLTQHDGKSHDVTLTADPPFAPGKPVAVKSGGAVEVELPVELKAKSGPTQLVVRAVGKDGRPLGAAVGWVTVTGGKPDPAPKAEAEAP